MTHPLDSQSVNPHEAPEEPRYVVDARALVEGAAENLRDVCRHVADAIDQSDAYRQRRKIDGAAWAVTDALETLAQALLRAARDAAGPE